jgi:uncharacterized membrane protein (DUF2068 family)
VNASLKKNISNAERTGRLSVMERTMASVQLASKPKRARESTKTLLLIAFFKLFKGLLLIAVAIGAVKLLHRDMAETVEHWVNLLRVDPDNRLIHALLIRILRVSPHQLKELSIGTFAYAGLFLTEGIGLLLGKRWAEYLTIVTTAGLIPIEVYEISKHLTPLKIGVLIVNIAIVVYLAVRVRRTR